MLYLKVKRYKTILKCVIYHGIEIRVQRLTKLSVTEKLLHRLWIINSAWTNCFI